MALDAPRFCHEFNVDGERSGASPVAFGVEGAIVQRILVIFGDEKTRSEVEQRKACRPRRPPSGRSIENEATYMGTD